MLIWIFGEVKNNIVYNHEKRKASGFLTLEKANVKWFLSIDEEDVPANVDNKTYRSIKLDGEEIEFSDGFKDLHTLSYKEILNGDGYKLEVVKPSIQIVSEIRRTK